MGLSDPIRNPQSDEEVVLSYVDYSIVTVFIIEGLLKIFVYGFYNSNSDAYIKNVWNVLDFISILISIAVFLFSSSLRFIIGFRAIRIIKLSQRIKSVRIVMISIVKSIPTVLRLIIFSFGYLAFLGLFPLKYFKGKYYSCFSSEIEEIHDKWDCLDVGGDWVPQDLRWDNILRSAYNIFIIATSEGWSLIMQKAWNATNVSKDHIPHLATQSKEWSIFFICAFVLGNKMVFNSFIGVLIEKFNQIKTFYSPYRGLKSEEKEWAIIKEGIIKSLPKKAILNSSLGLFRTYLKQIIDHNKNFKRFDDICTLANTIVFMLYFHRMSEDYKNILDYVNYGFLFIYGVQISLKITLYQKDFFKSVWNCFEVFLLLISITGLILRFLIKHPNYEINALLNFMQVIRSVRIIRIFKSAVELLGTIAVVLPSVGPIALLFCFVIYIWALIGLNLFPYLKSQTFINGYDLSFRTFSSTVASLIRVASSEIWFGLVVDAGREIQPNFVCHNLKNNEDFQQYGFSGCGHEISSFLYFFSFHLIVSIMIVNLLLALIIDGSVEAFKIQNAALNRYQLDQIQDLWMEYDEDGIGFISYKQFWQFSSRISIIYGVQQEDLLDINHKKDFLKVLQIPIFELLQKNSEGQEQSQFGYIYHDVIIKLTAISVIIKYGASESINDESSIKDTTLLKVPAYSKLVPTQLFSGDMSSIILMQRKIKKWVQRHQLQKQQSQKIVQQMMTEKQPTEGQLHQSGEEDIISIDNQTNKNLENSEIEKKENFTLDQSSYNKGKEVQSFQVQMANNYLGLKYESNQEDLNKQNQQKKQIYKKYQADIKTLELHLDQKQVNSLAGDNDQEIIDENKE